MDFRFDEVQAMLHQSAVDFLSKQCPTARVREVLESSDGFDRDLWQQTAELGFLGLMAPPSAGGAGLGLLEAGAVAEAFGASLMSGPWLETAVIAPLALGDQHGQLLQESAAGRLVISLAYVDPGLVFSWTEGVKAVRESGGYRLKGRKTFVSFAGQAGAFLVAAPCEGTPAVFVVMAGEGAHVTPMNPIDDRERPGILDLDVWVADSAKLTEGRVAVARLLDVGAVFKALQMLGAAKRLLKRTVEYAQVRVQFGRPIGSFQAIKHRLADMAVALDYAVPSTYAALCHLADGSAEAPHMAALAKAFTGETYLFVAEGCLQVHGGIGFTWECDVHLFLKHARTANAAFGDPDYQYARMAEFLLEASVAAG